MAVAGRRDILGIAARLAMCRGREHEVTLRKQDPLQQRRRLSRGAVGKSDRRMRACVHGAEAFVRRQVNHVIRRAVLCGEDSPAL